MYDPSFLAGFKKRMAEWLSATAGALEGRGPYKNTSGITIQRVYTPLDTPDVNLPLPGEYPYTRGIHPTGYRGRLWTMRMFAGFGSAEETNERYKFLLSHGETGLSVAFDLPTLMGMDADDPLALGEFGKGGVCVSSLGDMEILFRDIPVADITTSMTINGPAATIWAMYIANAKRQGISPTRLGGTLQNDILKEYIAQNEYLYPPAPALRLVIDTIEYGVRELPRWNPVSISGYHIREAGASAAQELAFTLADGFCYIDACIDRGMEVDEFAPRLSFFFNIHNDFFEEIAKLRAARRIYARTMREKYGAVNPRSTWLRFHSQTSGATLTAQQPENNVARVAIQALAAVLGGTQSLHTNALDEVLALPSETAARIALRTQQIIAHETGVTNTVDPLGGSFYLERLTDQMEEEARGYLERIDEMGGVIAGIDSGYFVRAIAETARKCQEEVDCGDRIVVGVNAFRDAGEPLDLPINTQDPGGEAAHRERLGRIRLERGGQRVSHALDALKRAAESTDNLMPYILEAVEAYATVGEISSAFRDVFGTYQGIQM